MIGGRIGQPVIRDPARPINTKNRENHQRRVHSSRDVHKEGVAGSGIIVRVVGGAGRRGSVHEEGKPLVASAEDEDCMVGALQKSGLATAGAWSTINF